MDWHVTDTHSAVRHDVRAGVLASASRLQLDGWQLEELVSYCSDPRCAEIATYAPGDKVFAKGDPGDYIAVLLDGTVDILLGEGAARIADHGAIFGEMGLIDQAPRTADAVAHTSCRIAKIHEKQFALMLEKCPKFSMSIMQVLTGRLRDADLRTESRLLVPLLDVSGDNELVDGAALVRQFREVQQQMHADNVTYWTRSFGQVNGDFYCSVSHPVHGWFGLFADGKGHGLASAIFGLQLPVMFRELVDQGLPLPAIHRRLNKLLMQQRIGGYFVCAALVHNDGRKVQIINAGMPAGLLLSADGSPAYRFASRNLPLGIADTGDATVEAYSLAHNETAHLLLLSDGVTELLAGNNEAEVDRVQQLAKPDLATLGARIVVEIECDPNGPRDDASILQIPLPISIGQYYDGLANSEDPVEAVAGSTSNAVHQVIDNMNQGVLLADAEQCIIYANAALISASGYRLEDLMGQTPTLLKSNRHTEAFYSEMWRVVRNGGVWTGEIWSRHRDGTHYPEWLELRALADAKGTITHYLATYSALAEKQTRDGRLNLLAMHDPITGLPNRLLLADRGKQAVHRAERQNRSLAVLFIELDRFHSINNSLGYEVGDQVLQHVAERLASCLREEDTLCRFGGDQFVCLLPDIAARMDAVRVVEKLGATLDQPVAVDGHTFRITLSTGVALYPADAALFADLLNHAERAMHSAKDAGGNLLRFHDAGAAAAVTKQLELEAQIDFAIVNGELELHYQPKVDIHTGLLTGAEALVRWRDPKRGLVPPGQFIPVAERSGLIARIGSWVLNEACAALARWEGRISVGFQLSINISAIHFERTDVAAEIALATRTSGIGPGQLQIEVTESAFIRNAGNVADTLTRIAAQGVSIALDDFGTGYSNLGSFKDLPLDEFKLDQSFVRNIHVTPINKAIARAAWSLADELDKSVVAEGIETRDELDFLKAMGYRIGQGYHFGKPLPELEFCHAHFGKHLLA